MSHSVAMALVIRIVDLVIIYILAVFELRELESNTRLFKNMRNDENLP